jgi:hypothetical protein
MLLLRIMLLEELGCLLYAFLELFLLSFPLKVPPELLGRQMRQSFSLIAVLVNQAHMDLLSPTLIHLPCQVNESLGLQRGCELRERRPFR